MNKSKGFTIIELIVVIAIIAVLASIVLVNVTQYISKGKDSSIKGNMASMATIGAAWFDDPLHTGFLALTADPTYLAGKNAIDSANGTGAVSDSITPTTGAAWCVQSTLNAGGTWCVDSTGYKGEVGSGKCVQDTSAACQ